MTALVLLVVLGALPAAAQEREGARAILERASQTLKSAKSLSFHAEILFDTEPRPGLLVQLAGAVDVDLRRPDRLHVDYRDEGSAKTLWYDGRKVTLLDWNAGVFADREAPATVDETLDRLEQKLGVDLPLADLVAADPAGALLAGALRGTYLGLHDVEGVLCHHIAILQENVDWELWVEAGQQAVPRKLLIRYKQERGSPQYSAVFMDWKIDPKLEDATFEARVPEDADRVEFIEVGRDRP